MGRHKLNASDSAVNYERRRPRQARGILTLESILTATCNLILKKNFRTLTTAQIAEHAGISVGSLYEYFPNKEAILLALFEEASSNAASKAREIIVDMFDFPQELAISRALERQLDVFLESANKRILIDLVEEMPELGLNLHPISYDRLVQGALRAYFRQMVTNLSSTELEVRVYFVNHIVMGFIRDYIRYPQVGITKDQFLSHLSNIVVSYLREVVPAENFNNAGTAK